MLIDRDRLDFLRCKRHADSDHHLLLPQNRKRPVVVARAIADASAATIEGGQRNQDDVGLERDGFDARLDLVLTEHEAIDCRGS